MTKHLVVVLTHMAVGTVTHLIMLLPHFNDVVTRRALFSCSGHIELGVLCQRSHTLLYRLDIPNGSAIRIMLDICVVIALNRFMS